MCKVKVYTTTIIYKYMGPDDEDMLEGEHAIMGRMRARNRRDKAGKAHVAEELGIKVADIAAYKETGYRIEESEYLVSYNTIKKYGKKVRTFTLIEG